MVTISTISAGVLSICLIVVGALFNANLRRWAQEKGHDVYILWLLRRIPKRWLWMCLALICALLVWPFVWPLLPRALPNQNIANETVSDPLDLTVLVSCEPSKLPEAFPTGVLYTAAFDYTGESDQWAPLFHQSGTTGTRIEWLPEQQHLGAKCQVSNQGADAIFHFEAEFVVSIHVAMQKAGHPEQGMSEGPIIRSNIWKLQLEQIGGRSQETVYIWNGGPNIVEITLPEKARAQRLGQPAKMSFRLMPPTFGSVDIGPNPDRKT
jgi:hypothetical protein